jgi:dTDP-glucose pyrophosphorylase
MYIPRVLAMVMAGGEGSRLHPLTEQRSKPAVPFGGRYRIVDFVLSNLVNSGMLSIYLLVQYKSQSLIEHVRRAWVLGPNAPRQFIAVVPPQMRMGPDWFQGTSDAVYQNLNLIHDHHPDLVTVFGADHIYRIDISQMLDFHESQKADVTVAALPVPIEEADSFGVIVADADGRIREFQEKPENPNPMPGDPRRVYASMGNYLFTTEVLVRSLIKANKEGYHDFGKHVLPILKDTHRVFAYDFATLVDSRRHFPMISEEVAMIQRIALLAMVVAGSGVLLLGSYDVAQAQCRLLQTTGEVEWIRVNNVGTGFGPASDFIDGEVIFKLTNGGNRYGFQLRNNANALVAQGGLSLLVDAMSNGWTINVDYNDCGGINHEVGFGRIRAIR